MGRRYRGSEIRRKRGGFYGPRARTKPTTGHDPRPKRDRKPTRVRELGTSSWLSSLIGQKGPR